MRCLACNGNGYWQGDRSTDRDCRQCNGSGEVCQLCKASAPNAHDLCEDCELLRTRKVKARLREINADPHAACEGLLDYAHTMDPARLYSLAEIIHQMETAVDEDLSSEKSS